MVKKVLADRTYDGLDVRIGMYRERKIDIVTNMGKMPFREPVVTCREVWQ
jgi:hypothetical protein